MRSSVVKEAPLTKILILGKKGSLKEIPMSAAPISLYTLGAYLLLYLENGRKAELLPQRFKEKEISDKTKIKSGQLNGC